MDSIHQTMEVYFFSINTCFLVSSSIVFSALLCSWRSLLCVDCRVASLDLLKHDIKMESWEKCHRNTCSCFPNSLESSSRRISASPNPALTFHPPSWLAPSWFQHACSPPAALTSCCYTRALASPSALMAWLSFSSPEPGTWKDEYFMRRIQALPLPWLLRKSPKDLKYRVC